MSIMLNDGTTVQPMVSQLRQRTPLTVISGFTPVLDGLRNVDGIELIPLGGNYRERHDCVVGVLCEETRPGSMAPFAAVDGAVIATQTCQIP